MRSFILLWCWLDQGFTYFSYLRRAFTGSEALPKIIYAHLKHCVHFLDVSNKMNYHRNWLMCRAPLRPERKQQPMEPVATRNEASRRPFLRPSVSENISWLFHWQVQQMMESPFASWQPRWRLSLLQHWKNDNAWLCPDTTKHGFKIVSKWRRQPG